MPHGPRLRGVGGVGGEESGGRGGGIWLEFAVFQIQAHLKPGVDSPYFSTIVPFKKAAVSPAVLMVFWKQGSLERMGKCPLAKAHLEPKVPFGT